MSQTPDPAAPDPAAPDPAAPDPAAPFPAAVAGSATAGSATPDSATPDSPTADSPTPDSPDADSPGTGSAAGPVVGLIMGSDSDWRVMAAAGELLDEFAVPYEVGVISAHRTPQRMLDYAAQAAGRGLRVIIAGAGGAAHLPGMVASATVLPVIGVPVPLATLDGMDSLLSIVQMPAGIPVACVSIGGARNAGLLAVRMLAGAPDDAGRALAARLESFAADLQFTVLAKHDALRAHTGH